MDIKQILLGKNFKHYFWSGADYLGVALINLLGSIVVARILSPSDFGQFVYYSLLINCSQILIDAGYSQSLLKHNINEVAIYHKVLKVNLLLSFMVSFVVILLISSQPTLNFLYPYKYYFFSQLLIQGCFVTFQTYAINQLRFKFLAKINFISTLIATVFSIVAALNFSDGLLVLILKLFLSSFLFLLLVAIYTQELFTVQNKSFRISHITKFAVPLLLMSAVTKGSKALFSYLYGSNYGETNLGYHSRIQATKDLFAMGLSRTYQKVAFPVLARKKSSEDRESYFILGSFALSSALLVIFIPAVLYPEFLVDILLGPQWIVATDLVYPLFMIGFLYPQKMLCYNFLKVNSRPKLVLLLETMRAAGLVVFLFLGAFKLNFVEIFYVICGLELSFFIIESLVLKLIVNCSLGRRSLAVIPAYTILLISGLHNAI